MNFWRRSFNLDAQGCARFMQRHEDILREVAGQKRRWDAPQTVDQMDMIESPEEAIDLWVDLCAEIGVDIVDGWNEPEFMPNESNDYWKKKKYLQAHASTLSARLPLFAAYLRSYAQTLDWTDEDRQELLSGMEIQNLPSAVHFLFYGLRLPKAVVSRLVVWLHDEIDRSSSSGIDRSLPYNVAVIRPCLDDTALLEVVDHLMDEDDDHIHDIVIGLPPRLSAPLLLARYFPSSTSRYDRYRAPHTQYTSFNHGMNPLFLNMQLVPPDFRTEIIREMGNDRWTKLHWEAFRHSADGGAGSDDGSPHNSLPQWRFRAHTEEDDKLFDVWLDRHYNSEDAFWERPSRHGIGGDDWDDGGDEMEMEMEGPSRRRATGRKRAPYHHPVYPQDRVLKIGGYGCVAWSPGLLNNPRIRSLHIPEIENAHYDAFLANPIFCAQLRSFHGGNNDSGRGSDIQPATLIRFVQSCPNLTDVHFESHTSADESVFRAILDSCPNIAFIGITGHDKGHGALEPIALEPLIQDEHLHRWPNLVELFFLDQTMSPQWFLRKVVKKRPLLAISLGDTVGNSYSAQMIAQEMGGGMCDRILGAQAPRDVADYDLGPTYGGMAEMMEDLFAAEEGEDYDMYDEEDEEDEDLELGEEYI